MANRSLHMLLFSALLLLIPAYGCADKAGASPYISSPPPNAGGEARISSSAVLDGEVGPRTMYNGEEVSSVRVGNLGSGMAFSDGDGGVVIVQGQAYKRQQAGYADARELKLKVRELGEQLVAGVCDSNMRGLVALPVSFVNQDNFQQSSSFGRYIAEQIFHEFNQRGFPIREYRIQDHITPKPGQGEDYLSRGIGEVPVSGDSDLVVTGTYYSDPQAVFVNARIIRPSDGRVLRTANLVLPSNALTRRMVAKTTGVARELSTGQMRIRDYKETTAPSLTSPFDLGEDIH